MKTGIIVWSQTGHTEVLAEAVQKKLLAAGKEAVIEKVETEGETNPGSKNLRITKAPDLSGYEQVVFASPVMAFSLAPAMKLYLESLPSLKGKTVALVVTKQLKFHWTGGNRAIGQMKRYCNEKGAVLAGTGILVWSSKSRDADIQFLSREIAGAFN